MSRSPEHSAHSDPIVAPGGAPPRRRIFTAFVASIDAEGGDTDEALLMAAWERLRTMLRRELARRGLWHSPPSYLGIHCCDSWRKRPGAGTAPIDELASDCYGFIFVQRLRALRAQLGRKDNIDGLVTLAVRQFVAERQRAHDPLGSRAYELTIQATRDAIAAGDLAVVGGDPRVRPATIVGAPGATLELEPDLASLVRSWNDALVPDLITARGDEQRRVIAELRALLAALPRSGTPAFRLRHVLDPMRLDLRARWAAMYEEDATARASRGVLAGTSLVPPDTGHEDWQSFSHLVNRVSSAILQDVAPGSTQRHLQSVWTFLVSVAAHPGPECDDRRALSDRRVAALLRVPRARLPELHATLRRLIEAHRDGPSAGPTLRCRPCGSALSPPLRRGLVGA